MAGWEVMLSALPRSLDIAIFYFIILLFFLLGVRNKVRLKGPVIEPKTFNKEIN